MRTGLTRVAAVYSSDRAFYTGLLICWELVGLLLELAHEAGLAPLTAIY